MSRNFINTLPYISNPIEEFKDFDFVSWERDIYPKFKGLLRKSEIDFFVNIIEKHKLHSFLDLGLGGGQEQSGIVDTLIQDNYHIETAEANELNEDFILQSSALFYQRRQNIIIHRANWIDLPNATPAYTRQFDFVFLTGNSLSYVGGGSREYTRNGIESIINKFSKLVKKGGFLFIDTRNFDYIKSLINVPIKKVMKSFTFNYSIYYHGSEKDIIIFPAYISDTIVVLHYYDKKRKIWSKLDYFPIYQRDMIDTLEKFFKIEKVYHDFSQTQKSKSLFVQYLVKKIY